MLRIGSIEAKPGSKAFGVLTVAERPAHSLDMPLTLINGAHDGPLIAITAGIHGTEYVGIAAALDLIRSIDPQDVSGGLVIVPVVDIPGFEWRSKCTCPIEDDYIGTQNINRLFPGKVDATIAHLISHTLFSQVASKANFIIDLHGGDIFEYIKPCTMAYTIGKEDFDDKVVGMARASGMKYCIKRSTEGRRGGLVVECANLGIPGIVIESGDHGVIEESKVSLALDSTINILRYLKVFEGEAKQHPEPKFIKGMVTIRAIKGGVLRSLVELGSSVSAGDKLGEIQGLDGSVVESLISPVSGFLIQWSCNPSVTSGESVIEIAEFY